MTHTHTIQAQKQHWNHYEKVCKSLNDIFVLKYIFTKGWGCFSFIILLSQYCRSIHIFFFPFVEGFDMFFEVLFYAPSPWCSCSFITWYGRRSEGLHQFLLGQMFFVLLATIVLLSHYWVVERSLTNGAEAVGVVNRRALSFSGLSVQLLHWNDGLRNGWDRHHTHIQFHQRFMHRTILLYVCPKDEDKRTLRIVRFIPGACTPKLFNLIFLACTLPW